LNKLVAEPTRIHNTGLFGAVLRSLQNFSDYLKRTPHPIHLPRNRSFQALFCSALMEEIIPLANCFRASTCFFVNFLSLFPISLMKLLTAAMASSPFNCGNDGSIMVCIFITVEECWYFSINTIFQQKIYYDLRYIAMSTRLSSPRRNVRSVRSEKSLTPFSLFLRLPIRPQRPNRFACSPHLRIPHRR
jgi:hypothetical protein